MISKITTKVTITGLVLGFVLDVPSQGSSFCICISTLPATWLFGWPHKRSAYRLHIFKLLYIHILTLHFSWLNFDFSFITWLHPLITNFRRGNLRGNKQSKLTRTSPPQNCTETNLDMEWQGVNNAMTETLNGVQLQKREQFLSSKISARVISLWMIFHILQQPVWGLLDLL